MKLLKSITILILLATACTSSHHIWDQSRIEGRWCLNKSQLNYPEIDLGTDSIATLKSMGDTIYSYRYVLDNNILKILKSPGEIISNKILKLTADSLVLETFLENKERQCYSRCR